MQFCNALAAHHAIKPLWFLWKATMLSSCHGLCGCAGKYRSWVDGGMRFERQRPVSQRRHWDPRRKKIQTCTQMGMHMHTSNGTSVRRWTSGLVKRWGGVCRVLCYSFIPLCCPLVLIMVASFKFQTDVLQKQICPLYTPPLLVWDLVHGTKRAYICACVCVSMGALSLHVLQSVLSFSVLIHLSICICACRVFFFSVFSIFFCNWRAFLCLCVWCAWQRVRLAMYASNGSALFFPGTAAIGLDWCVTQAGTLKGERLGQTWSC